MYPQSQSAAARVVGIAAFVCKAACTGVQGNGSNHNFPTQHWASPRLLKYFLYNWGTLTNNSVMFCLLSNPLSAKHTGIGETCICLPFLPDLQPAECDERWGSAPGLPDHVDQPVILAADARNPSHCPSHHKRGSHWVVHVSDAGWLHYTGTFGLYTCQYIVCLVITRLTLKKPGN